MEELREYSQKVLFISIASGKSLTDLETALEDPQASIVRVMPNVNVSVGAGVSAICKNEAATEEQLQQATMIFEAIGSVYPLAESDFSTFIGLAGSSPAFVYMLIDAMGRTGVLNGLSKQTATEIAAKAIMGSCQNSFQVIKSMGTCRPSFFSWRYNCCRCSCLRRSRIHPSNHQRNQYDDRERS